MAATKEYRFTYSGAFVDYERGKTPDLNQAKDIIFSTYNSSSVWEADTARCRIVYMLYLYRCT